MLIGLLCVIAIFLIYVGASLYRLGYWSRRGIPGPQPRLFVGALNQLNDPVEPNVLRIAKWTQKYGRVFGFQKGWRNFLVISEPALVKEITTRFDVFHERETIPIRGNLDTEGAIHVFHARGHRWARIRSQSMKLLSTENLKKIYPTLNDAANRLCERVRHSADSPSVTDLSAAVDVHPLFCSFTVETISRIVFGDKYFNDQLNNKTQQSMENVILELLNECDLPIATLSWSLPWFSALFGQLRLFYGRKNRSGLAELIRRVDENIQRRKSERRSELPQNREESGFRPLLDDFLDAESKNVKTQRTNGRFTEPTRTQNGSQLTPAEINAQCCAFLIAGFGTSSSTLALICFYLARNPKIQRQIREEVQQKCADPLQPTFAELRTLRNVDAVVKECLRLHPVGTFAFGRKSAIDVTLSDGTEVAKGTHVLIDVPSLHRDRQLWGDDAEEFRPNRWLHENEEIAEENLYKERTDLETSSDSGNESMSDEAAELPKSDAAERKATAVPFYPFGGGPRMCPGYRMACLEIRLAVAKIFAEFELRQDDAASSRKPQLHGNLILLPEPVLARFQRVV